MNTLKKLAVQTLFAVPAGQAQLWEVSAKGRVAARAGRIWVTREGDPADYWLEQGLTLQVSPGDRLWVGVEGDREACLSLSSDSTDPRWNRRLRGLFSPSGMPSQAL